MRTPAPLKLSLATLAVAAAVSACRDARATDADADLQRDLALASTTVSLAAPRVDSALLSSLETRPQGAPEKAPVLKKAEGPRAVRSRTPTVRAAPVEELAAAESEEEVVEVMEEAPAPEEITEPVAVAPRPQPVVVDAGGSGDYGDGNGGVWGGGTGVIIRGGGVHGDNCELHYPGRGGVYRGPVFFPRAPNTSGGTAVNLPRPSGSGVDRRGMGGGRSDIGISSRNPGRIGSSGSIADRSPSRGSSSSRGIARPRGR